nr:hypothetical protein GCM10020063_040530 [Dactylosporangium thailandense]
MSTPDGTWRIEVIRQAHREWCRLLHGTDVVDDLDMDRPRHLLTVAGVNVATLAEIGIAAERRPRRRTRTGLLTPPPVRLRTFTSASASNPAPAVTAQTLWRNGFSAVR